MNTSDIKRDCSRGCTVQRAHSGELICKMHDGCCKLSTYNWLEGLSKEDISDLYEIRFKNTHKAFFKNTSGAKLYKGDIVAVEAANGHDVGIVSIEGPMVLQQLQRHRINPETYELKKIYRKVKTLDLEKWQEAIAREHHTMIRARQIAASLELNMKIGDVEFQGDGTKAIFYYIADERVDFRRLIKLFADEFRIRIEMRQIGARQEAGLIGGIGVCGQELCCSRFIVDFVSITTQAARCQDLSLNPQKLAGQCSKLKCCINYEAATYIDAQRALPQVSKPLETEDGLAYLMKTDVLSGRMWFSYDPNNFAKLYLLSADQVREIIRQNRKGIKPVSLVEEDDKKQGAAPEFKSAVGEGSLTRFDDQARKREDHGRNHHKHNRNNNHPRPNQENRDNGTIKA